MRRIHRTFRSLRVNIERVVQRVVLADDVCLRVVVTPGVEVEILTAGEVVLLIDLHPFAEECFFLRRQFERTFFPIGVILRIGELGADDGTGTDLGSIVITAVGEFDMIAVVCQTRRQGCVRFAFHTYLAGRHRVRSHGLVDLRNEEIVDCTTAGAYLDDGVGLHGTRLVIHLTEIRRHLLGRFPRAVETGEFVIVGQTAVEVLTVYLESVEVPSLEEHLQQVRGVGIYGRVDRTEVPAVPPGDVLMCPLVGEKQHLRVLFDQFGIRVSSERCPPQFGFHAAFVYLVGDMTHVGITSGEVLVGVPVAFGDLITVIYVHPFEAEFSYLIERAEHHIHLKRTSVAPCAPYGFESLRFRGLHLDAFVGLHILREGTEGVEVVALVYITERLEATQGVARGELQRFRQLVMQRHGYLVVISLPCHRHRDHAEHRFEQTDGDTAVPLPEVHYRDTASVVGVVHAEVVLFLKAFCDGQYPIHTGVGTRRLERPYDGVFCLHLRAAELVGLDGDRFAFVDEERLDGLESLYALHRSNGLVFDHAQAVLAIGERLHVRFGADKTVLLRLGASIESNDRYAQR